MNNEAHNKVEILTEKEAAEYIGMSQSHLLQDRINGYREGKTRGPDFLNRLFY